MKEYNGHRSWNAWNVALWIANDYGLYQLAIDCLQRPTPKGHKPKLYQAVNRFMHELGGTRTPDGAVYNRTCVRLALEGLKDD